MLGVCIRVCVCVSLSPAVPGPPVILTLDSGQDEALISWEAPVEENGKISSYSIYADEKEEKVVEGDVFNTSVKLKGCRSYNFFVKAQNGAGWGLQSEAKDLFLKGDGKIQLL